MVDESSAELTHLSATEYFPQHGTRPLLQVHQRLRKWMHRKTHFLDQESHSLPKAWVDEVPAPAHSDAYGTIGFSHNGFDTQASIADDGRVDININQRTRKLWTLLAPALRHQVNPKEDAVARINSPARKPSSLSGIPSGAPIPPLNIVMHVVGSRGDVQPFVSLGLVLKERYGHRVRLATHLAFKQFVEENGLEFFNIGGDPAELMAFMVKNPGLMPGYDSFRSGEIGKRRKAMYEILIGCWRSCIEPGGSAGLPFVADAIIANPPSLAHIHCAEKLGVPLHLMFTMPWSPTQSFPHPLANIQSSNAESPMTNFVSYALVELMIWQGLGDIINRFRRTSLGLDPVGIIWAPGLTTRLRIPYTYCWSPALIPKPRDWGSYIDISGFFFLSLAANYLPAEDLTAFLAAGPKPIYVGFGSIIVADPTAMTKLIFDAVRRTGQRALVSKGWGGFGADQVVPEGIFMLGNVPHDWLFKHVSCVVHHGGAGTTAAGIALGRPTVVIPFFGDQRFWGTMVARAGAGPTPIPHKELTAAKLAAAIMEALQPTALQRAGELGAKINKEKGAEAGAQSFHRRLHVERCALAPNRVAVWRVKRTHVKLSTFAAATLSIRGFLDPNDLRLYQSCKYDTEDRPWGPISGASSALLGAIGSSIMGIADFPTEIFKALRCLATDSAERKLRIARLMPQGANYANMSHFGTESTTKSEFEFSFRGPETPTVLMENPTTSEEASEAEHIDPLSLEGRDLLHSSAATKSFSGPTARRASRRQPKKIPLKYGDTLGPPPAPLNVNTNCTSGTAKPLHLIAAGEDFFGILREILTFPVVFMIGVVKGLHNMPIMYGDTTVRQPEKITGLQSGLKAAGKEFGFGLYDGMSGVVTQPYHGAKKEGSVGLLKGLGKGLGGLIIKPTTAVIGLPLYTMTAFYREVRKHSKWHGMSVERYLVAARTAQGYEEWDRSTAEERLNVVDQFHAMQAETRNIKNDL